jgi:cell division protein FtsB
LEKKKRGSFKWFLYIVFWLVLVGAFGALAMSQASEYSGLRDEIARQQAERSRAVSAYESLQRQMAFIGSDAYIEQQARQRLGMVKSNEIILKNIANP